MFRQRNRDVCQQLRAKGNPLAREVHLPLLVHLDHVLGQMNGSGDAPLHPELTVEVVHQEFVEQRLAFVRLRLVEFLFPQAIEGLDE